MDGDALLDLQRIDSALEQIVHRRSRLGELTRRDQAAAAVAALRREQQAAQRRADDSAATIERTERDAAELTAKRTRLEGQLKTVIAPREAEALMHEIATLNARRSELDDQELDALDAQTAAADDVARRAATLPSAVDELDAAEAALDEASGALDSEQSELAAARAARVARIGPEDLAVYEQARRRFNGVAVAKLDGTRCDGCHLDISRGELDAIRALPAGELGECPQCGRFLVR